MKIELKEKESPYGYGYDITVTANPKNIEKVFDSLEEYKDDNLDDDDDFEIIGYVEDQDKINILDYYGSFTNEFIDYDDALDYAGILTSFEKDVNKLFISIENAVKPYDEEQVKLFFFSDIIDTEEDRINEINKIESEIKVYKEKIDALNNRIKEIKNLKI